MTSTLAADAFWWGDEDWSGGSLECGDDGRIREVTRASRPPGVRSLVLPGFVNAHCHLDLSFEPEPGSRDRGFGDWLLSMRDLREDAGESGLADAAREGVERSLRSGTTTVVDYDARGCSLHALEASPLRRVILREVIALGSFDAQMERALESFLAGSPDPRREIRGIAPHAPYTVRESVLDALLALIRERACPWSMHIAEQPFEAEFLQRGTGPLADFFRTLELDPARWPRTPGTAFDALRGKSCLESRPLLVHGNYLRESDFEACAAAGTPIVHCPRSHRWFGHDRFPLAECSARGVIIALGTDGLVSNGELSVLEEMREIRRSHPELSAGQILELGTAGGHRALGNPWGSGRIEPGQPADLVRVKFETSQTSPLEALLQGEGAITEVWIDGAVVA